MGPQAEIVSRILTEEVDEIQIIHGVGYVGFDLDVTRVERKCDDSDDDP